MVEEEHFQQAQELLRERGGDYPRRSSTGTAYLLTSLLRCSRCGHGFIGTCATGKNGRYRYYTCYCRQSQGTARCDQQSIPADRLEEAILAETLSALTQGSIFAKAANKALTAWTAEHPSREADLRQLKSEIAGKKKVIDRYLRGFRTGAAE